MYLITSVQLVNRKSNVHLNRLSLRYALRSSVTVTVAIRVSKAIAVLWFLGLCCVSTFFSLPFLELELLTTSDALLIFGLPTQLYLFSFPFPPPPFPFLPLPLHLTPLPPPQKISHPQFHPHSPVPPFPFPLSLSPRSPSLSYSLDVTLSHTFAPYIPLHFLFSFFRFWARV